MSLCYIPSFVPGGCCQETHAGGNGERPSGRRPIPCYQQSEDTSDQGRNGWSILATGHCYRHTEEEAQQVTGHALRPTGAQFMARLGIDFYKIQLFCRWGSEAILRYLREVPLEDSDQWLAASLSVGEVMTHSARALDMQTDHPKSRKMVKAIQNALETRSTQILQSANQTKEEIE